MLAAGAGATPDRDDIWPLYWQALRHQCPAKHLDLLAPADLRAMLDGFKAGEGQPLRAKLDRIERRQCRGDDAVAGCANLADLEVIEKRAMLAPVTAAICSHFLLCQDQSDCTAAPAAP